MTTISDVARLVALDGALSVVSSARLRVLLRDIVSAAGDTHDDWSTFDPNHDLGTIGDLLVRGPSTLPPPGR